MKTIVRKILENNKMTQGVYSKLRYYYAKFNAGKDDEKYAVEYYYNKFGRKLNLHDPKTFDEKIWWLKFNYHNQLLTKCADKYLVREYIKEQGLEHILNDLYAVYDDVSEIKCIDHLPEKFYLKCNHVSGGNVACFDKKVFDLEKAKKKLSWYMNINQYYITREWQYKNIKPKIICEKFLENNDSKPLVDYKFYCFNGNPQMVLITHGTAKIDGSHEDAHLQYENYYDMRLKPLNITDNSPILSENEVIFPSNYQEMKKYATVLAEPFPFVRVDFYEINKKIIFGELTFTCAGGCHNYNPLEFNEKLGSYLDLSKISLYE